MINPVLVEVLRGGIVESRHRGAVFVCGPDGKAVLEIGDVARPVFPRSAAKAIQALPLVESGAAEAYGFGDRELALACASHAGQAIHTELAASMLSRAGLDHSALECGTHWPFDHDAMVALARSGREPNPLCNNCSGKHSGFLCTCRHIGIDNKGYVDAAHPFQQMVREIMQAVTGADHNAGNAAIDGCSIPTYAVPLKNLALGFARMTTGQGLGPERARAAGRLLDACMAEPLLVSGAGKADVALMQAASGRIFTKIGAEGVFCAAVPELGLGIALKCDDGAERGAQCVIAAVLAKLLVADDAIAQRLTDLANTPVRSRIGVKVGALRPTEALA